MLLLQPIFVRLYKNIWYICTNEKWQKTGKKIKHLSKIFLCF